MAVPPSLFFQDLVIEALANTSGFQAGVVVQMDESFYQEVAQMGGVELVLGATKRKDTRRRIRLALKYQSAWGRTPWVVRHDRTNGPPGYSLTEDGVRRSRQVETLPRAETVIEALRKHPSLAARVRHLL